MNLLNGRRLGSLIVCIFCFVIFGDATICKPLSKFKIDCNACECSGDGRKYSCSEKRCQPVGWNNFFEEINKDGYVLLKPKQDPKREEDDFVLTRRNRQIPYIDDQIFLSNAIDTK